MILEAILAAHAPADPAEAADVARLGALLAAGADLFSREAPLHLTGSALVVHPPSHRVLLRWHEHLGRYLHVGGHMDTGEDDPAVAARREAEEETGLGDLSFFPGPDPDLCQVAIVTVPERRSEGPHEHADFRYLLATATPDAAVPERPAAALWWCPIDEALVLLGEDRLARLVGRVGALVAPDGADGPI